MSQQLCFWDGVSEGQFNQILNIELDQIIKAFQHLGESWLPKFTVVVAQKNYHTKLFQAGSPDNVPVGTVVDSMCSMLVIQGTMISTCVLTQE